MSTDIISIRYFWSGDLIDEVLFLPENIKILLEP
jgi:hypothetical protein